MAAWRKEEVDAARHRQERGNETGKVVIAHGSVEFCEGILARTRDGPRPALRLGM